MMSSRNVTIDLVISLSTTG